MKFIQKFIFPILLIVTLFLPACFLEESESENEDKIQHYNLNESFIFDNLKIAVTDYYIAPTYIYEDLFEADTGFDWAIVSLNITNESTTTKNLEETILFSTSRVYQTKFIYNDIYEYSSTFYTIMGTYIPDIFIRAYDSIEPLATISGICAFKIPEAISQTGKHEFVFKFNDSSEQACYVLLQNITNDN